MRLTVSTFVRGGETIYRCHYSKDVHKTNNLIAWFTHSPYATKIARIRCYTTVASYKSLCIKATEEMNFYNRNVLDHLIYFLGPVFSTPAVFLFVFFFRRFPLCDALYVVAFFIKGNFVV